MCSGEIVTSRAPRLSLAWARVRAPMTGDVTAGFASVQAIATWDGVAPTSSATARTTSATAIDRSLRWPDDAMTPFRVDEMLASRESATSDRAYLPVSTPPPSGDQGST